ncbi:pyruvate kinase [Blastopirellula sp. JC732]|uniref:pyruvate kinase n=1 Tax=Blastopirellula sediminis TaxID=2894196 RepID=A0A9X1SLS4_9BACT|nr:pyruvate kinase [Blastopirellula sediminis]MCC9605711.1 pyruvate kinase [Blastopirellula sediminis]MCC9630989.1 pyruvate kinase [Blastopirellula sediminis]
MAEITGSDSQRHFRDEARVLIAEVDTLRTATQQMVDRHQLQLDRLAADMRESGENLVRYVAARQFDLRPLQLRLHELGVSSLGRMEAYVEASLIAVLRVLQAVAQQTPMEEEGDTALSFRQGRALLVKHAADLFGHLPPPRQVSVMTTMPSEAAQRPQLIHDLLAAGMNVMRINCSQDSAEQWRQMIDHLRAAEKELGLSCKVFMDLAGPNPRTGPLTAQDRKIEKTGAPDNQEIVVRAGGVSISPSGFPLRDGDSVLTLKEKFVRKIEVGDRILVRSDEEQLVVEVRHCDASGAWGVAEQSGRFAVKTRIELYRQDERVAKTRLRPIPTSPGEASFRLHPGETLVLTASDELGRDAIRNEAGEIVQPAVVGCTLPVILPFVQVGQRVLYDDGDMEAIVRSRTDQEVTLEITRARKGAVKIRSGKGLNFPDTDATCLNSLTEKDHRDLEFIVQHADAVGFSFVRNPVDVQRLLDRLDQLESQRLGVVLKIETQDAFRNLPMLLLTAMQRSPVGVMVARGDMGAELGFRRMSEVQEEILWICEAAHVPVIWATEVLDSFAKSGVPTRGDVTDAAMAGRAECVMLNKGEYIVETLEFLIDVLGRMGEHQRKKFARLLKLNMRQLPEKEAAGDESSESNG